jgi:hypothetical protein
MLLRAPGATFFHSSAWAGVLSESYGYTPMYFTGIEGDRLRALVPLMEVKSFLTGKRGVSLPFTDSCEPILEEGIEFQALFARIIEYGQAQGWKYIELRGGKNQFPVPSSPLPVPSFPFRNAQSAIRNSMSIGNDSSIRNPQSAFRNFSLAGNRQPATGNIPFVTYLTHTLDLTKGERALHSGLRDSTRRNIRKAEKEKVEVRIEKTGNALKEFCRLNRLTRREHGLPPQPHHFFEKVHRHVISQEKGFIALAYFQGKAIAGNVYFHFGDRAVYKYGASDKACQHLRANNLVMWEAIRWFAEKGFKSFCFGRTEPKNEGLRQFKAGWGAEEAQVHYFKYDLRQSAFVPGKEKGEPAYAHLFRATPAPILNAIGTLLYRHMG